MRKFKDKIISQDDIANFTKLERASGKKVVFTNGCFDLMHVGHATYLQEARSLGDSLIIGVNSDLSVKSLKGESRPIVEEDERLAMLAALECVDGVVLFHEKRADGLLKLIKPDLYVKGGDYTEDSLILEEREAVYAHGGKINIIPFVDGYSTTKLIDKIRSLNK